MPEKSKTLRSGDPVKKAWETPKLARVGIVDTTRSSPFPTFPSRGEDTTYSTTS